MIHVAHKSYAECGNITIADHVSAKISRHSVIMSRHRITITRLIPNVDISFGIKWRSRVRRQTAVPTTTLTPIPAGSDQFVRPIHPLEIKFVASMFVHLQVRCPIVCTRACFLVIVRACR